MDYNITTMALISAHHNPNNYVFNGKMMLCSVIILFVVVLILICFHNYSRWFSFCRHRPRRSHHRLFLSSSFNTITNTNNTHGTVPHEALDISILKTIPTFVYFSTIHKQQLECAVCLSEFEDKEKGRVLPRCKHSFHVDCIDMWFRCHSNCPLCRAPVQPDTSIPVEEVASVTEPAGFAIATEEDGDAVGCSSSSSPPLDLVSVIVELPRVVNRGLDDMVLVSKEETGFKSPDKEENRFKSPDNRVLTLKRIWSI